MFARSLLAALALVLATPVLAETVQIADPYARAMGATAKTGAAFLTIENHGDAADRLVGARSDVAERVELHTHKADADGTMKMMHVPEGFEIPAHGSHQLARGGDHVMLLGLTRPLAQGDSFALVLTFEKAGEVTVQVPVDLDRKPDQAAPAAKHSH